MSIVNNNISQAVNNQASLKQALQACFKPAATAMAVRCPDYIVKRTLRALSVIVHYSKNAGLS
ncbi:MAG: hypothetical protein LBV27_06950 [Oscillospiraceae bacterium]|jgi:hypothetical protein|nr:hypothetical protein [Oscillospiraceae bacterium]